MKEKEIIALIIANSKLPYNELKKYALGSGIGQEKFEKAYKTYNAQKKDKIISAISIIGFILFIALIIITAFVWFKGVNIGP